MARHIFPRSEVYVFTRDAGSQEFAKELGAVWAGNSAERAPRPLRAIIDTTPAWKPIVEALANLLPGGRLVINAIRKEDDDIDSLLQLNYQRHLWMEREIKTVANITGRDIREFLAIAAEIPVRPQVVTFQLEEANKALVELKRGRVKVAKVLVVAEQC